MVWSDWNNMSEQGINSVPKASGVYQLNLDSEVLYHGQTTDLNRRLKEHLNSDSCISRANKFAYQTTDDPEGLEEKILQNYKKNHDGKLPPCNEQSK